MPCRALCCCGELPCMAVHLPCRLGAHIHIHTSSPPAGCTSRAEWQWRSTSRRSQEAGRSRRQELFQHKPVRQRCHASVARHGLACKP